jgi:ligand-binding SRPBCC domain-containing protein
VAPHLLERSQFIPRPRGEVFAFFADATNLEAITPAFLRFTILTPTPVEMRAGARIDYALSLFHVRFRWRTEIQAFEPEERFVDVQLSGPYRRWRHTHRFEEAPGGTLVSDRVEYELPLGPLGEAVHALIVARQLKTIFDHRAHALEARFGGGGREARRATSSRAER